MHLHGCRATGLMWLLAALFLLSLGSGGGPVAGDDASDELLAPPPPAEPPLRTRPVLLIPGFASSQLHAWKRVTCAHSIQKNLYRDVNIGDRIWIDVARILAQGDCWVNCMKLHVANQSEIDCKLRAADGMAAVSELDPGLVTGPLSTIWGSLMRDLIETFGLGPDELVVAPYDWRLPPSQLQARDQYFSKLKHKIEYAVQSHGNGDGHSDDRNSNTNSGMVVVAHSMGNGVFRYFLEWLKLEVGRNHWQRWIDRHISAYFAVGSPLLGSSEALELLSSGLTQGLPLSQREIRKLVATFGSIISFLPVPSGRNSSHDSDTLLHVRMDGGEDDASSINDKTAKREVNYTSAEIATGQFFRDMAARDPLFGELEKVRKRFYEDDDVLNYLKPWDRPPIASVFAVYGVNLPTKHNYRYEDTDVAGHWYQLALEHEDSSRHSCSKTGDGTVPYHSLSFAHTWLNGQDDNDANDAVVDVTQVPQSVYLSETSTRTFQAVRDATTHHAEYRLVGTGRLPMCPAASTTRSTTTVASSSSAAATNSATNAAPSFFEGFFKSPTLDQITFFERTRRVDTNDKTLTTGVWEIDGAGHRDILGHPAFLRELRAELRNLFTGSSTPSDKTSRSPAIDSDCYWNYRRAKCEFPTFCEYRYSFGDVILDQSCRLRAKPKRPAAPLRPPLVEVESLAEAASLLDFSRPFCSAPCRPTVVATTTAATTAVVAVASPPLATSAAATAAATVAVTCTSDAVCTTTTTASIITPSPE